MLETLPQDDPALFYLGCQQPADLLMPRSSQITTVAEQLIQNQLFDRGVRGILQITQRKQQSGSSALNKEG